MSTPTHLYSQLATGLPPLSDFHPLRVLFLIPKSAPPQLEGDHFSDLFKDFVGQCLTKDFHYRPSAPALLNHPFIATAHETNILHPLIEVLSDGVLSNKSSPKDGNDSDDDIHSLIDEWNWSFGTLRPSGTVRKDDKKDISQTDMARKYAALDSSAEVSHNRQQSRSSSVISREKSRQQSSSDSSDTERIWNYPPTRAREQSEQVEKIEQSETFSNHLKHLSTLIDDTSDPKQIASLMILRNSYRDLHDQNHDLYTQTLYHNYMVQGDASPLPYKTNEISKMLFDRWTEAISQKYLL